MTTSALHTKLRSALLQKLSQKTLKKKNHLQAGFTLVELMVVIVIVGILTSVALPQFLSQGVKAKGTEAKSDISGIIKNTSAEYQQGGAKYIEELALGGSATGTSPYTFNASATSCDGLGGRPSGQTKKFDYFCSLTQATANDTNLDTGTYTAGDYVLIVTGVGDTTDTALQGKVIQFAADLNNGHVQMVNSKTCKVFGGTNTGTPSPGTGVAITGVTLSCS